jgi:salicylate 5-hydroxylase large subunit
MIENRAGISDPTQVPYWIYSDPGHYKRELEAIFYGPHWHYVGIESEIPNVGDYKRTVIGERPVLVVRSAPDRVSVVLNRCAHRGVEICRTKFGHGKTIVCPYHQWSYGLDGGLLGVPFRRGMKGEGGYPADFDLGAHGLETLTVNNYNGLLFASFDPNVEPFADAVGPEILPWIHRAFDGRKMRVLGYQRQRITCNWKVYVENLKDSYHATLLHVYLITFLARAGQVGIQAQDARTHANHMTASARTRPSDELGTEGEMQSLRKDIVLHDPRMFASIKEYADDYSLVIAGLFPNFIVQMQSNNLQVRQAIPLGPDAFELSWTFFGYEDDTEELTQLRLRQANLSGAAGYISVDDTEVLEWSGSGMRVKPEDSGILALGGSATSHPPDDYRRTVSEAVIRGFYRHYFDVMGMK